MKLCLRAQVSHSINEEKIVRADERLVVQLRSIHHVECKCMFAKWNDTSIAREVKFRFVIETSRRPTFPNGQQCRFQPTSRSLDSSHSRIFRNCSPIQPDRSCCSYIKPTIMSIDPPAYIVSLQNNIRARPISWEGAVRAKTITDEDLKKIKAIDKVRKEQRKQTIEGDVKTYTALLLGSGENKSIFESAVKRTDILQYMLVLTGDLVDGTPWGMFFGC